MRELIRRLVGIPYNLGGRLQRLEEYKDSIKPSKPFDQAKIEQELEETRGVLGALMEHLDMDVRRTFKPDPQFLPPEPRMKQVYEVYPRQRQDFTKRPKNYTKNIER